MLDVIRLRKMLLYKGNAPLLQARPGMANGPAVRIWRQLTLIFLPCYKTLPGPMMMYEVGDGVRVPLFLFQ
jgi:hypothetical protein